MLFVLAGLAGIPAEPIGAAKIGANNKPRLRRPSSTFTP
jgi:hypothetical protein